MNHNELDASQVIVASDVVEHNKFTRRLYFFTKRVFDIVLSFIGLVLSSPILIIIAILIKLDSKGPVLFKHKRIGKNGEYIYLYKFRSMVNNAEELKANFTKKQKEEFEKNYKLDNDPRITRVGKVIRKLSLDELPQIINILKGDMSIVGPRPVIDGEIDKFGAYRNKFLSVYPGLTGYWACNGRSCTSYEERIGLELYYVNHCSLILDMKIIFKTALKVIKRDGAK